MLFVDGLAVVGQLPFVDGLDYVKVPEELAWIARVGTVIQMGSKHLVVRCIIRAASSHGFMKAFQCERLKPDTSPALFLLVQEK